MSPFEHGEVFVLDDGGEVNILFNLLFFLPWDESYLFLSDIKLLA